MKQHEFDPGYTGLSERCNQLVGHEGETYASECGMSLGNVIHTQKDSGCIGCLTGHDIGVPSSGVAYAHPGCPVHGDEQDIPDTPEDEEMHPSDEQDCICPWTDPSMWLSAASCGYGSGYEPGSQREWDPNCPVHPPSEHYGDKVDAMALTLKVIAGDKPVSALGIVEEFDTWRRLYEGEWLLAKQECEYNPGSSCADVMRRGNGHCCLEYDQH